MNNQILFIISLFLIVFISGCVQQPQELNASSIDSQPNISESINNTSLQPKELRFEWIKDEGVRANGGIPFIHKLKDGRYRLYYCGEGGILSAISSDGFNFQVEDGVRVLSSYSYESIVCDPTVVNLPDGRFRMYYKGSTGGGGPGQAIHKIFSAISTDGLSFQKEGLRIDSEKTGDNGWASVPDAIMLPDGRVRIYYVSANTTRGIASAISDDGLSFQIENDSILKEFVDPAVIILPDGRYLMLANLMSKLPAQMAALAQRNISVDLGIHSFISDDGLTFGFLQIVLEEPGVADPSIVQLNNNTYRVFFGKESSSWSGFVTQSLTGRIT